VPKSKDYPEYICHDCGVEWGTWYSRSEYIGPPYHAATYHKSSCDLCGKIDVVVTEPRDYGHLKKGWDNKRYR